MITYKHNTAYYKIDKLLYNKSDTFIVQGGQGAGKTISILMLLIEALFLKYENGLKCEISIVSEELSKMRKTVVSDFVKIMQDWELFKHYEWNKTECKYKLSETHYIEFLGLDKTDVGKGMRRDIVYFNEGNKCDIDGYIQIASRSILNIVDFNPDEKFWGHELINENNFINLTFQDNEYLSQGELKSILDYKKRGFKDCDLEVYDFEENIKNRYWANKWRVYGLGKVGILDGIIFPDFKITPLPLNAELLGVGVDFGFTNDPTSIVEFYKLDGEYYFNEVCYGKGMSNRLIAERLKPYVNYYIVADSSEPKSIEEIRAYDIPLRGAIKGAGSINSGIDLMKSNGFNVTPNSENLINELETYVYEKDRLGKFLNKPKGGNDHAIDGARYISELLMSKTVR